MPTEDVLEGRCGCGRCKYIGPLNGWRTCNGSIGDSSDGKAASCPHCHWKLYPDGFARQMADCTVEKLREMIADHDRIARLEWEDYHALNGTDQQSSANDTANAANTAETRADELKRLLPEEAPDE